jgi:hypothetical protein
VTRSLIVSRPQQPAFMATRVAESRTLPDTPIRRVVATVGVNGISNCAGERALPARLRERRKGQPALSSKELTRTVSIPGSAFHVLGSGSGFQTQKPGSGNEEPRTQNPGICALTTEEQHFRKRQRI